MGDHYILISPECAPFASKSFPNRPQIVVPSLNQLEEFLGDCSASSVMYYARWPCLTVGHSRALAEWASEDPTRGCGVRAVGEENTPDPRLAMSLDDLVYDIEDGEIAREVRRGLATTVSSAALASKLSHNKHALPKGVALSGHGAEYCIRFGNQWLTTIETGALKGSLLFPHFPLAAVVFLNGCSTLRLGDSSVPERYSLARALNNAGAAVIGSFRNMQHIPNCTEYFASALEAGKPLGQIVNGLNIFAKRNHQNSVTFQLLGDPTVILSKESQRTVLATTAPPSVDLSQPHRLICESVFMERLCAWLVRWTGDTDSAEFCGVLRQLTDRAGQVTVAIVAGQIEVNEMTIATNDLECTIGGLRSELIARIADYIQQRGWLEAQYASSCYRSALIPTKCRRCRNVSHQYRYEPFATYLPAIEREDCDACGTVSDRIGTGTVSEVTSINASGAKISVLLPEIPDTARGILFIHKMPTLDPIEWPSRGGVVSIGSDQLAFPGRLTLVASVLTQNCLSLSYYNLFIDPADFTPLTESYGQ